VALFEFLSTTPRFKAESFACFDGLTVTKMFATSIAHSLAVSAVSFSEH
jgi:hypothetical protein